ncbi:hypothetical protein M1B72_17080 [Geomonas paludis]|uniref:Uncharacterized protein n=1 Tax=Geomonas paludis TaxID=2740185 RepID=A0A6V8MZA2_9BACT|nr:hypothetical protein [Geomonas paludis]UPU35150.1 hypothetical protein M1B72_17080 [Geomonas paludis]GFO65471.1 hypothetical protein GMPD_33900 [Geomonas paludis]
MEAIFELIFGLLWELFANIIFQLLVELGLRSLVEPFRKSDRMHPVFAFIGSILLGSLAGVVSLWIAPNHIVHSKHLQGYGLLFVPLLCGVTMAGLRQLKESKGRQVFFLDSFTYGYTFALFMSLVRFYRAG